MKRHVTSALIAGAMTAVSGIAFFLGISRSIAWLFGPAYLLMTPGLFLAFFLGLGSGAHGAVLHTDVAQYVLTFLVVGSRYVCRRSCRWRQEGTERCSAKGLDVRSTPASVVRARIAA
jgi:hypothetical protein